METVQVYRVEHRVNGVGPYNNPDNYIRSLNMAHNRDTLNHPSMGMDFDIDDLYGLTKYMDDVVCGMASYSSLKKWFKGFGNTLALEGFVVRVYEVPRNMALINPKSNQVVFNKEESRMHSESKIVWD